MKNFKTGLLAATAVCGMLFVGATAQATTIGFNPGANFTDAQILGAIGGGTAATTDATSIYGSHEVNENVNVNEMAWIPTNNDFASNSWNININSNTNTFTENFVFILNNSQPGSRNFGAVIAGNASTYDNSYVTLSASLSGNVLNDGVADFNDINLQYTGTTMFLRFHPDGDATNIGGAEVIAEFGNISGSAEVSANSTGASPRLDLNWVMDLINQDDRVLTAEDDGDNLEDVGFAQIAFTSSEAQADLCGDGIVTDQQTGVDCTTTSGFDITYSVGRIGSATTSFLARVPEPGALGVLGVGLIGLAVASRRRRKAS